MTTKAQIIRLASSLVHFVMTLVVLIDMGVAFDKMEKFISIATATAVAVAAHILANHLYLSMARPPWLANISLALALTAVSGLATSAAAVFIVALAKEPPVLSCVIVSTVLFVHMTKNCFEYV